MLDDYINEQPVPYKMLLGTLKNNKLSHAYLFETNNYHKGFDMALSFAKYLLCPNGHTNTKEGINCSICQAIDNHQFPELKIIESDGIWIKKEQLDILQKEFSKKAIGSERKVYIINRAERLNPSAANSILKFLEEPEPNIVAILVTSNKYLLLDTIVSRCQIISLKDSSNKKEYASRNEMLADYIFNSQAEINDFLEATKSSNIVDKTVEFFNYYEKNGKDTLFFTHKLWHSVITSKEENLIAFMIGILYYKDVLNYQLTKKTLIFEADKNIEFIANNNTSQKICDKINVILNHREKIKYNINNMLLIDKLIIEMEN